MKKNKQIKRLTSNTYKAILVCIWTVGFVSIALNVFIMLNL